MTEKPDFKERLEQVILINAPSEPQKPPISPRKPTIDEVTEENETVATNLNEKTDQECRQLPTPPKETLNEPEFYEQIENEECPKPPEELVTKMKEEEPQIYDEGGYLKPSAQFRRTLSERPPLALPRQNINEHNAQKSADKPPALLPRVTENKWKKPDQTVISQNQTEEDVEEATYEAVEESKEKTTTQKLPNYEPGTFAKIFGSIFKTNKKNPSVEPTTKSLERPRKNSESPKPERSLRNRPLPELPKRELNENNPKSTRKTSLYVETKAPEEVILRSKSENNLLTEENATYGNAEVEPIKLKPESYEQFCPTDDPKLPLPLPPNTLPNIPLDPAELRENSESEEEEGEEYGNYVFNINDDPFYRNTDRRGARQLLQDLEDGAFLFRPSRRFFLTLSLKYKGKYFNLGFERRLNNKICLNTENESLSPEFATLADFVEYFTTKQLTFQHQGQIVGLYLKKILPRELF
ncbi:proteoglycan 4-like isoform X2 [Tribolium madens]|nr:proteoglycan 4-like isoform X2 [Tribolium madens]